VSSAQQLPTTFTNITITMRWPATFLATRPMASSASLVKPLLGPQAMGRAISLQRPGVA